jgi:hypothetical protein
MNSRTFEKRIFRKQTKENSKTGLCHDLALEALYNLKPPPASMLLTLMVKTLSAYRVLFTSKLIITRQHIEGLGRYFTHNLS